MSRPHGRTVLRKATHWLVRFAAFSLLFGLTGVAHAQKLESSAPSEYTVRKGDTLYRIATRTRASGVSLPQMVLALYRANPDAFLGGNINQLVLGKVLKIPGREAAVAVEAAEAVREVRALVARPLVPIPPAPQPAAQPAPSARGIPPKPAAAAPALSPAQAEASYAQGQALERKGDLGGAFKAYLAAGQSGHGPAQKKLGDLYNMGNAVVARDYETALKWYQKAREHGVEIPKPLTPGILH